MNPSPEEDFRVFVVMTVVIVLAGLAILVAWYINKLEAQRRAAYAVLAAKYGLQYRIRPPVDLGRLFPSFSCFDEGHSRRVNHLLDGRIRTAGGHEVEVLAGEWRFLITTNSGRSQSTTEYRFGFVILGPGAGRWPGLQIRRENLLDRLAGALGWDDIDFESAEFSRRFHVKSADKRFAYDLLDPQMIELFLIADSIPQVDLGGEHACLHFSRGTVLEPPMLDLLIQWGTHLVDRIPRVVRAGLAEGRYGGAG